MGTRMNSYHYLVETLYYDSCKNVLEQEDIAPLPESLIPAETQQYYLSLLLKFEK